MIENIKYFIPPSGDSAQNACAYDFRYLYTNYNLFRKMKVTFYSIGVLWPRPTGETDLGRFLSKININNIEIQIKNSGRSDDLMNAAGRVSFFYLFKYAFYH